MPDGRVLIAFDDGPLEPDPTWTRIDAPGGDFPDQFVSGYDTQNGKQNLLDRTETGTGTVYINDHKYGLFDPRNSSSPYYGKLDGKQIQLQLWDPVRGEWEPQFRGQIDSANYDIDGSAVNQNGEPINASIQLDCVDMFDYLNGFGLTPGLSGVRPPVGGDDGVWYAPTGVGATVDDRFIEILADAKVDESRYVVFSGNVGVQAVKYDADEPALNALRDAADAEFPFIANMYVDRFGRFVFHGRYGRFAPFEVSADAGPDRWDFHYWLLGDGKAISADATRVQMRVLSFSRARNNIVNVAVCTPQNMPAAHMPNQVFADVTSEDAYGKRSAPPLNDLLTAAGTATINGFTTNGEEECFKFAKLLVLNQKDPREAVTALQVKSVRPEDSRAAQVWSCLTQVDVSDLLNLEVGYPYGTGFTGQSPEDDYFVEGRQLRVRPLDRDLFDYVELDLNVSPYLWSSDPNGVFPTRQETQFEPLVLTADFSVAY